VIKEVTLEKKILNTKTQRLHRQNDNQQHTTKQHHRTKEDTKEKLKNRSLGRHKDPNKTEISRGIYLREISRFSDILGLAKKTKKNTYRVQKPRNVTKFKIVTL